MNRINWEMIGAVAGVISVIMAVILGWNQLRTMVSWPMILLIAILLVVLIVLVAIRRKWAGLWNRTKAMVESIKARVKRFRACLRGDLEQCYSELKTEREKYKEERAKVDKLTLALATLSQHVLSLFDERMEKPDELEWGGALAASKRAARCARAALCHHVTKIVYYDPIYPASWMKGENAEKTRDYFVDRWFVEKNAQQLRDWIHEVLKRRLAYKSLIVFAQDIVPETVAEVPNETCLLRRYLNAGGRVVWWGDIPFWRQGKTDEALEYWDNSGPQAVLGVSYYNYHFSWNPPKEGGGRIWDSDLPPEITPMGRDIGLTYPRKGIRVRPVPCQDVDVAYAVIQQKTFRITDISQYGRGTGDFALCWKKNFNERYPHSGFMQYFIGEFLWRDDTKANFFKFAIAGWPLFFD